MRSTTLLTLTLGTPALTALISTQFPHLIIPLVSLAPDTSFGTRFDATISYDSTTGASEHTEISFDVPVNNATSCRLAFYINRFPSKNAPRSLSGVAPYTFNISRLESGINKDTDTWNSHPATTGLYNTIEVTEDGEVKSIYTRDFVCPKGTIAQFLMHPAGNRDLKFYWYELNYPDAEGGPHGVVLEMSTT